MGDPPKCLRDSMRQALRQREARQSRRKLTILPPSVDFSSNDFLSLSTSPAFRERFLGHLQKAPPLYPFASGGSRLLDGNSAYAEDLENYIASFHNAPCGLLFNSGYDANVGVYSSIPQPGDLIVYDELVHASAHEGMRLSRAGKRVKFPHSSPGGLEAVLQAEIMADRRLRNGGRNVFIAIESVYSMDGDVAPIREFVGIIDRLLPNGNGYFIVDEAHATGVFGPRGSGVVQEMGLEDRMFVRVHTFGKALASHGGKFHLFTIDSNTFPAIVLCCPDTKDYLINYARSLIYTTALGFPFLASIRAAYELLDEGETKEVRLSPRNLEPSNRISLSANFDSSLLTFETNWALSAHGTRQ